MGRSKTAVPSTRRSQAAPQQRRTTTPARPSNGAGKSGGNGRAAYEQLDDEGLLLKFRESNDNRAFNTLVRRYERPLYNYLFGYLHHRALAEDVFQATFLRIHEKAHLFTADRKARPWIYSIATHEAIDALRREGRHQAVSLSTEQSSPDDGQTTLGHLVPGDLPTPFEQSSNQESAAWMRRAIAKLPAHLSPVVLLVFFQNLKYREVAEILNIPVGTVKSRLHTAVCELAQAWQREHPHDVAEVEAPPGLAKRACAKAARNSHR